MPVPPYTLIRQRRSSISVTIQPDGTVVVKAPKIMPQLFINRFLESKSQWIHKKLEEIKLRNPIVQRKYEEGEEFLYLGNSYQLSFINSTEISIKENKLLFPKALQFRIKKELESWYIERAKKIITERVEARAKEMDVSYKSLMFSDTKSKWGSCGPKNDLQFSWRLVMVPLVVLDYVVIHELAHTVEKNHGERFWKIVSSITPAYKAHRKWLTQHNGQMVV